MLPTIPVSRRIRSRDTAAGDVRRLLWLFSATGLLVAVLAALLPQPVLGAAASDRVDLARDAGRSRALAVPVVVVVSRTDCPWCGWLRENVLVPSTLNTSYGGRAVIRELFLDSGDTFVDFDGVERDTEVIAQRYDASFTPTVLFLDDRGEELVAAIRGVASKDFYAYYFDDSIAQAASMLRERR